MSDPFFFVPKAPLTLAAIVALTDAIPSGHHTDAPPVFVQVAALDRAGPRSIAMRDEGDDAQALARTRAGACFVTPETASFLPPTTVALVTARPAEAFARVIAAFHPDAGRPGSLFANKGISPAAFIHPDARLEAGVAVDPGVVIGPRAEIGSATVIGANSVIGPGVRIGRDCAIGAQVTISHALIGNRVTICPGVRIGQDRLDAVVPGLGRVIIQDAVAIGANTTIDRGGLRDTILGEGARIGNLLAIPRDRLIPRGMVLRSVSPAD